MQGSRILNRGNAPKGTVIGYHELSPRDLVAEASGLAGTGEGCWQVVLEHV